MFVHAQERHDFEIAHEHVPEAVLAARQVVADPAVRVHRTLRCSFMAIMPTCRMDANYSKF
jgi:hypothetical protein